MFEINRDNKRHLERIRKIKHTNRMKEMKSKEAELYDKNKAVYNMVQHKLIQAQIQSENTRLISRLNKLYLKLIIYNQAIHSLMPVSSMKIIRSIYFKL